MKKKKIIKLKTEMEKQTDVKKFPRKFAFSPRGSAPARPSFSVEKFGRVNPRESAITWRAAEFEYQQKDPLWYWGSLLAALILLILAIWQKNFLFILFVIVAELVIIYFADRRPLDWDFKIDERGIHIGKQKFYPYSDIDSFDIHPHVGGEINPERKYKELVVKLKSRFSPYLKINIQRQDEEKIKAFLLKFVPEQEHPESLSDALSKLIRF